jgi:hypothetical protein
MNFDNSDYDYNSNQNLLNEDNPFWKWSILFDYFKLIFSIINNMNYYNFDTKEF